MVMTRKQALAELITKVEAGDIDASPFWKVWTPESEDGELAFVASRSARGSLDAALALHKAVLPGWEWSLDRDGADVWINNPDKGPYPSDGTPARAWLLAILKALHAQEADQ